jgi:hypothetical protein
MNPRTDALKLAEHTRKNLDHIEAAAAAGGDVDLVTQLLSSLLGLVVFPWERHFAHHIAEVPIRKLTEDGWPSWHVTRGYANTLGQLLRCLRNAGAYGHIQLLCESDSLDGVMIEASDYRAGVASPHWSATISASDLRGFCHKFMDLVEQSLG